MAARTCSSAGSVVVVDDAAVEVGGVELAVDSTLDVGGLVAVSGPLVVGSLLVAELDVVSASSWPVQPATRTATARRASARLGLIAASLRAPLPCGMTASG